MNDGNDEFDQQLEALFAREHTHLPAEPFSSATLRAIAAARKRVAVAKRAVQAAAVLALVAVAPHLIAASVWLSSRLDELFASASAWLASPFGFVAAGLLALLALAAKAARLW